MNHVIFDLGGVLLDWNPRKPCAAVGADPVLTSRLLDSLLMHPDWIDADRGLLDRRTLLDRAETRSGLERSLLEDVMEAAYATLRPIPEALALVDALRNSGRRCHVLSNMHDWIARRLESDYSFLEDFDTIVFSCDTGMAKPDAGIWPLALERCCIRPGDAVFLDDSPANIHAAGAAGIHGVLFSNAGAAGNELRAMGLLD